MSFESVIAGPQAPALALSHVSKAYGAGATRTLVLDDVSLSVMPSEIVWLRGPSGGGKSSLVRIAGLLALPTAGSVRLGGQEASARTWSGQRRARSVGVVFQNGNLLADLTVATNLRIAAVDQARDRIPALLETWGLTGVANHPARLVSGGELQRAALLRALVNDPLVLLADEPTSALDEPNAIRVLEALILTARAGTAVLVASHDPRVSRVANRMIDIAGGRVV